MSRYGPRDAACVLMSRGHRVAWRWTGSSADGLSWHWTVNGRRVSLSELEDMAEGYERLKNRYTERKKAARSGDTALRSLRWLLTCWGYLYR